MVEYLTVQEVADRLRVSRQAVSQWCRTGELKAIRAGRSWRITTEDLAAYVTRNPGGKEGPKNEALAFAS